MPQRLLDIILGCLLAPKKDDKPAAYKCAPRHTLHDAQGSMQVAGTQLLHLTAVSEHRTQQRRSRLLSSWSSRDALYDLRVASFPAHN